MCSTVWRDSSLPSTETRRCRLARSAPFALPLLLADALAGVAQLGDQTGLLILCKRTGDLAHHLPRRVVACGQVIARGRQQPHPSADQEGDTQLLGHQLAREAAGVLDDDDADTICGNLVPFSGHFISN